MKKYEIEIDATENMEITEEDLNEAFADIKKYNLDDFDFVSADELYLDDEEDGVIFGYGRFTI
jgi:hypothetical protein